MYPIFFIHSSVDGHVCCFHVMAIRNSATMYIEYVYLLELYFSPDICLGVGFLDHIVVLFLFFRNLRTVLIVAVPICIPTNHEGGFSFLHTLSSIYCS